MSRVLRIARVLAGPIACGTGGALIAPVMDSWRICIGVGLVFVGALLSAWRSAVSVSAATQEEQA